MTENTEGSRNKAQSLKHKGKNVSITGNQDLDFPSRNIWIIQVKKLLEAHLSDA